MRILVDMDGVLADFEQGFLDLWRENHPNEVYIPIEERTIFYLKNQYPSELKRKINEIFKSPDFYSSFPIFEGGFEAISDMSSLGHEVFICTSPPYSYENCVLEKYKWVEKHLGIDWTRKIILTIDKTIVRGEILIDDNPEIKGVEDPTWEHIIYDQPYNREVDDKRRVDWQNWKEVLGL